MLQYDIMSEGLTCLIRVNFRSTELIVASAQSSVVLRVFSVPESVQPTARYNIKNNS